MYYSLKNDELILLYLLRLLPITDICNKIIKFKNEIEYKDTMDYYLDRYDNICKEHYNTKNNHYGKFSYIFDNKNYIIKRDHRLHFYKLTGISYQVLELLYELIRINNDNSFDINIDDKKEWLKYDDILYSELSKHIMVEMKKINLK